ncbi:MAG: phosphoadenylyl-sulfate reductase [Rhodospirillaceae bacterium]|nr:phosphoadenylyl-sulfate reductase [Rhodospirillaceae bacterium]
MDDSGAFPAAFDDASPPSARASEAAVDPVAERVRRLTRRYGGLETRALLSALIRDEFPGRIALVSSFGTEAAVLLHLVATVAPRTPVIFLDTGKLFGETLRYRDALVARLGLTDVRSVRPDERDLAAGDPEGVLWSEDPDRCCFLRKVLPLRRALAGFDAWINGRKAYHGGLRTGLPLIEAADGRVKVNPLAGWSRAEIGAHFARHGLPHHPLEADGFTSIGCLPCSSRAQPREGLRAGRWRGLGKTECGIHLDWGPVAGRGA